MKATIVISVLLGLALLALTGEPAALAAGIAVSQRTAVTQEPVVMLLSGASLLTIASLVRRYVPDRP